MGEGSRAAAGTARWLAPVLIGAVALFVATPPPAGAASAKGKLEVMHGDDFANNRSTEQLWLLEPGGKRVRVLARKHSKGKGATTSSGSSIKRKLRAQAGRRVTINGRRQGNTIVARSVTPGPRQASASSATSGNRRVAVIIVKFGSQAPVDNPTAREAIFTGQKSARSYYSEVSHGDINIRGKLNGANGDVFGPYKIKQGAAGCGYQRWGDAGKDKARANNDLSGYDHFVTIFPANPSCTWGGWATINGKDSWINGWAGETSNSLVAHELGHNFGLRHANAWDCGLNTASAAKVPAPSGGVECTTDEEDVYGDPFDVMGKGYRHLNTFSKYVIGQHSLYDTRVANGFGDYFIQPASADLPAGSPKMLQVRHNDSQNNYPWLAIEYRQPFGLFDDFRATDPISNGVVLRATPHLSSPLESVTQSSKMLDMSPWDWNGNPVLPVGKSYWNWERNNYIKLMSANSSGATIRYGSGRPPDTAVVGMYGRVLVVLGTDQPNGIEIQRHSAGAMAVTVTGSDVLPGKDCGYLLNPTKFLCSPYGDIDRIVIDGGAGADIIASSDSKPVEVVGGPGADIVGLGSGNDTFRMKDGTKDYIACGPGNDLAELDAQDVADTLCEQRR